MPDIQKIPFICNVKTVTETENLAPSGPAVGTYSSFFFLFLLQIYSTNKPSGFLYYQPFPRTILLQKHSLKAGMGKTRVPVLLFSHRSTLSAYQFPGNISPTLSHERNTKENSLPSLKTFTDR